GARTRAAVGRSPWLRWSDVSKRNEYRVTTFKFQNHEPTRPIEASGGRCGVFGDVARIVGYWSQTAGASRAYLSAADPGLSSKRHGHCHRRDDHPPDRHA